MLRRDDERPEQNGSGVRLTLSAMTEADSPAPLESSRRWLLISEAADHARVSGRTIRRWVACGYLRQSKPAGGRPKAGAATGERGDASFPVIGIASGSAGRVHGKECLARYNLISVRPEDALEARERLGDGCGAKWRVDVMGRGLVSTGGKVGEIDRYRLW